MKLLSFFVWLLSTYCGVWRSARVVVPSAHWCGFPLALLQPTERQLLCIWPLSSAVLTAGMTLECFDALGISSTKRLTKHTYSPRHRRKTRPVPAEREDSPQRFRRRRAGRDVRLVRFQRLNAVERRTAQDAVRRRYPGHIGLFLRPRPMP